MENQKLEKANFIAKNATLVGPVELEEGSSVWFGAVLRCDSKVIRVGKNSNIQDNAVLHCDGGRGIEIGENVTVGHSAIVHGATVGNNVVVGMHATLLDDCVIGDNCIIGAGALVKERQVIPAGSLVVGVPAKVVRQLSPEALETIRENADEYVECSVDYAKRGFGR